MASAAEKFGACDRLHKVKTHASQRLCKFGVVGRMKTTKSLSVQIGCGRQAPLSWLNFDSSPTLRFERLPLIGLLYTKNQRRFPANIQYGDIVSGLPIARGTVDRLYASHVLEHLAYDDAMRALHNSFAILKAGGVFRLIVPDLATRACRYVDRNAKADPQAASDFMDSTLLGERARPAGIIAKISAIFGSSLHRWMWDEPAMRQALEQVGFRGIRRCQFGDSNDAEFNLVEEASRFVDNDIVEVAMECRKLDG
jgi:hypothetical protein